MNDNDKVLPMLKRLLETNQDVFIFEQLQAGTGGDVIKAVLRIDTDRITRVSKLMPKKIRKRESEK
jgi:hypothetical protein